MFGCPTHINIILFLTEFPLMLQLKLSASHLQPDSVHMESKGMSSQEN